MKETIVTLAGAAIGAALGYFAFAWLLRHGWYGMILPGGLLGMGAAFGKPRSLWLAVACGFAALALGLFTEWRFFPFRKDDSLAFFLKHVTEKDSTTLLMIAIGGALGFWMPFRRREEPARPRT